MKRAAANAFLAYKYQVPTSTFEFLNPIVGGFRVRPYFFLRALALPQSWQAPREEKEIGDEKGWPNSTFFQMPIKEALDKAAVSTAKLQPGALVTVKTGREEYFLDLFAVVVGMKNGEDEVRVRPVNPGLYDPSLPSAEQNPFHVSEGVLAKFNGVPELTVKREQVTSFSRERRISVHWSILTDIPLVYPVPMVDGTPISLLMEGEKYTGSPKSKELMQHIFSRGGEYSPKLDMANAPPPELGLVHSKVSVQIGEGEVPILIYEKQANSSIEDELFGWE